MIYHITVFFRSRLNMALEPVSLASQAQRSLYLSKRAFTKIAGHVKPCCWQCKPSAVKAEICCVVA